MPGTCTTGSCQKWVYRTYVRSVDRLYELGNLRRSNAMLQPGSKALDRETAMKLNAELELEDVERRCGTSDVR